MTQKFQEKLYKAIKSRYEADINKAILDLDRLFDIESEESIPTYYTDRAISELNKAQQKLKTLEDYMQGSKPLKQLLKD